VSNEKAFFRYIRGELLNGFYIRKLNLVANTLSSMSLLKAELLYWMKVHFTTDSETFPMRHRDIKGIGQVCGILSYIGLSGFLLGWFRFSESFIYGDKNRSERGLLVQETGELEYVRLENDTYPTDISTIATGKLPDAKRMSLIPDGTPPVGYIWGEQTIALLENGMINEDLLHPTPQEGYVFDPVTEKWEWDPVDPLEEAPIYAPWYGDKYMALARNYPNDVVLSDSLMLYSIEAHQKIKYNGLGFIYLFEITTTMVYDLIEDLKIELLEADSVWFYKMTFTRIEENFPLDDGWGRFSAWLYLVQSKYPFIQFNESGV
jgi:hypothetical protein